MVDTVNRRCRRTNMKMLLTPRMLCWLKYGFLLISASGMFITILPILQVKKDYNPDNLDLYFENFSQPYMKPQDTHELLQKNATFCLPSKQHIVNGTQMNYNLVGESTLPKDLGSEFYESFVKFNTLLMAVDVQAVVIEPSILFCMLQDTYKNLLRKRDFDVANFSGSPNVITYAIRPGDAYKLEQEENADQFTFAGFVRFVSSTSLTDWMLKMNSLPWLQNPPGHLFYIHGNSVFHLVMFYERRSYSWHPAIGKHERKKIPIKANLLFVNDNSAYEKFSFVPLQHGGGFDIYIPSSPHYFLFQMLSSRFLECDLSRAANLTASNEIPKTHSSLSVEEFNIRTFIAIRQLKAIFQPLLQNLWIWSGTMLGWYRQCDIIPYTTDVDFAAWADEVLDLDNLIDLLRNNRYVSIQLRMGMLNEALEFQLECRRLRTDIFFMYRIENGSWYSGHRPSKGYYFRYYCPHFSLCSAELLGEKVQVPCETEDVIANEYGTDWGKPKATWAYESSIHNRGPNIYWGRKFLKDAYKHY